MSGAFQGHVLVVDDDPSICRMFQLLLRDAGYRVSTVGSGEELLQFLKVLSPDVILLDISLPGINGVDATRQIKSDPDRAFIPIILITALGDMKTKVAGLDAGADDFLVKPVEFAELLARVRAMMRLQHSRRGLQEAKQRMEVLLDFSQMLSTSIDVETLAHRVVVQLRDAVGAIRGSIILINERHDPVVVSTTQQAIDSSMLAKIMRDGVGGWVIRAGKPLLLSDARMDQRWIRSQRMLDVTSSVACVPILHNQTVLGVITLVHNRVNYFNQEHIDLMQSMAAQSAVALLNARLFSLTNQQKAQLEHRSHHLEEILTVGERLRLNLPLETALSEIAEAIRRSLGFERVMIQILSSATGGEVVRGRAGPRPASAGDPLGAELTDAALLSLLASPAIKRQRLSRSSLVSAAADDAQAPRPGQPAHPGDRLLTPVGAPGSLLGLILADLPPESAVPALETIQSLEVFADQVSGAVQNSQVFAREQQRANQLQLLVDVSRSLTELMTPDQVGRLVTSLIQHTFGFFSVAMLLREQMTLVLRATADAAGQQAPLGLAVPLSPARTARLLRRPPPGDEAEQEAERWLDYSWIPAPIQSELAVPITSRNEILGVLVLASDQPAAFDQQAETMLSALAAQVSVTLENAQLFAREQAHVSQLNRINSLSIKLTAELDVSAILDEVLAEIATIFDSERAALLVFDAADQRTTLAARVPEPPGLTPELPPPAALIAAIPQRRPLMTAAGATNQVAFSKLLQALKLEGAIIAPLPLSDSIGGLLVVERAPEQPLLRAGDRNLVQTVANLLAQSLANGRLYRAVADERRTLAAVLSSTTDPLLATGALGELLMFNRAAEEALGLSDELIGVPLTDPAILAMLDDAGELAGEHRLPDGRIVRPSVAPVGAGGARSVAQVVVLQDITSIKLLEQQRMQRLRDDMLRYMSPPVVEQLLDAEDFGEATERDVVVLFADLRGFTALSEGLAPRIVVEQVLNRFFATMTEVLYQHEGTIDKFMGDGIMAVFGSPRSRDDDALRAVEAAIAMQQVFPRLRSAWKRELGRDVGLGVGVSFGRAVVGNLGSPQRLDYTLVGDVVNTASRLVNLAHAGQIIVAEQLVNQLDGGSPHEFRKLPPVELKGKAERIDIFEVVYAASETAA